MPWLYSFKWVLMHDGASLYNRNSVKYVMFSSRNVAICNVNVEIQIKLPLATFIICNVMYPFHLHKHNPIIVTSKGQMLEHCT